MAKKPKKKSAKPPPKKRSLVGRSRPRPASRTRTASGTGKTSKKPAAAGSRKGRSPGAAERPPQQRPAAGRVLGNTAARAPGVSNRRAAAQGDAWRQAGAALAEGVQESETRADPGLTQDEIEHFRQLLLEKRAEILGDMATLRNEALTKDRQEAAGDLSSMPIHMAELGTDNYELEFTLGLIEGERVILREIEEALERIKNGTYGVCLATGKPIGKTRLRAKPWAKYCYEYTLAQEQGRAARF